jgi:hypothetical protein
MQSGRTFEGWYHKKKSCVPDDVVDDDDDDEMHDFRQELEPLSFGRLSNSVA